MELEIRGSKFIMHVLYGLKYYFRNYALHVPVIHNGYIKL